MLWWRYRSKSIISGPIWKKKLVSRCFSYGYYFPKSVKLSISGPTLYYFVYTKNILLVFWSIYNYNWTIKNSHELYHVTHSIIPSSCFYKINKFYKTNLTHPSIYLHDTNRQAKLQTISKIWIISVYMISHTLSLNITYCTSCIYVPRFNEFIYKHV